MDSNQNTYGYCHEVHTAIVSCGENWCELCEPAKSWNVSERNVVNQFSCLRICYTALLAEYKLEQSGECTENDDWHVVNEGVLDSGQNLIGLHLTG